jgi:hypothetical protein
MFLLRTLLMASVALTLLPGARTSAIAVDSPTVTLLSGDLAGIPNAPAESRTVSYSIVAGELWQGARIIKSEEPIATEINFISGMSKVLYVKLCVCSPDRTSFAEVVSMTDRLKRAIAEAAHPSCKVEILVLIPNPVVFEPPTGAAAGEIDVSERGRKRACSARALGLTRGARFDFQLLGRVHGGRSP